jgi:hypothetical protein
MSRLVGAGSRARVCGASLCIISRLFLRARSGSQAWLAPALQHAFPPDIHACLVAPASACHWMGPCGPGRTAMTRCLDCSDMLHQRVSLEMACENKI